VRREKEARSAQAELRAESRLLRNASAQRFCATLLRNASAQRFCATLLRNASAPARPRQPILPQDVCSEESVI